MLFSFRKFVKTTALFNTQDKILLAVSGGIDSVTMAYLFHKARYKFAIAHCNFQLRGKESDEDEIFVRNIADTYNVPFYSKQFPTEEYAKRNALSIQMAARELRYKWFDELLRTKKYDYVATGHNSDDQTETFFINLSRGTGIAGIHGISCKENKVIRPLLFAYRKDIEAFVRKHNLLYREDSSNISDKYIRNEIRHNIIPLFCKINPNFKTGISNSIKYIRDAELLIKKIVDDKKGKVIKTEEDKIIISLDKLLQLHPLSLFIYEFLSEYNFNSAKIKEIEKSINRISGKKFTSPTHILIKNRKELIVYPKSKTVFKEYRINEKQGFIKIPVRMKIKKIKNKDFVIPADKHIANLDYENLTFPLILRKWKSGDYFYPLGMKDRKKLSDFFIDSKFSVKDKEDVWLLCSKNKIAWITGHRIDNRFKITKNTRNIYQVSIAGQNKGY